MRNEYNNYKIQADDNERRNRDRLEDMKIKKMNLENIVKAKEDEIGADYLHFLSNVIERCFLVAFDGMNDHR